MGYNRRPSENLLKSPQQFNQWQRNDDKGEASVLKGVGVCGVIVYLDVIKMKRGVWHAARGASSFGPKCLVHGILNEIQEGPEGSLFHLLDIQFPHPAGLILSNDREPLPAVPCVDCNCANLL